MSIEVKIAAVGESITSGVVSVWHKKSGDFVNEGEAIFTLETDKVSTEIVAEKAGVLETKVPEGREVKIGEVVATIDDSQAPPEEKKTEKPPEENKGPEEKKKEPEAEKKGAEEKAFVAAGADRGRPGGPTPAATLSPAVRRVVEEKHVEPEEIAGTGKEGRLTKGDVLAAVPEREKAGGKIEAPGPSPSTDGP